MKSSLAACLLLRLRQCAHPRRLMITPYWLVGLQLPIRASREESKGSSVFSGTFKSTRVSWQMKSSGGSTELPVHVLCGYIASCSVCHRNARGRLALCGNETCNHASFSCWGELLGHQGNVGDQNHYILWHGSCDAPSTTQVTSPWLPIFKRNIGNAWCTKKWTFKCNLKGIRMPSQRIVCGLYLVHRWALHQNSAATREQSFKPSQVLQQKRLLCSCRGFVTPEEESDLQA